MAENLPAPLATVNDAAGKLRTLMERRDLTAYNCVNAIQFCLLFFAAHTFAESRQHLQDALDQHKAADQAITEFHLHYIASQKKENQSDVRSTAQSTAFTA